MQEKWKNVNLTKELYDSCELSEIIVKKISSVISDGNLFFAILEPSLEELSNVFAVDKEGKTIWQIKNVQPKDNMEYIVSPMVGINLSEDNHLFATDLMGRKFRVNKETGKLQGIEVVK